MTPHSYLITGASSGLGYAVAEKLLQSGNYTILTARREELLLNLSKQFPTQTTVISGDITDNDFQRILITKLPANLSGAFINAGGPPAKTFKETAISDWDEAYNLLVRWKIKLVHEILPLLQKNSYGRILFSESTSITRPVQNLVLSNSLRMVIAGLIRTLVHEYKNSGITFNILAPGYHETKALNRLFEKLSLQKNISPEEAKKQISATIPVGEIGSPSDYASLAAWLLGSEASFVTGQIFTVDGGASV
jgi:3-oxoacyl-[acyl-carrier protein] reductase